MRRSIALAAILVVLGTGAAQAQGAKSSGAAAASAGITNVYHMAHGFILKTAELVPEEKYGYQPTKEVRTLGAILGHIADAQNFFCATIAGTPKEYAPVNEKLTNKAAIVTALKASFDVCNAAYAGVTDADLTKIVEVFGQKVPLSQALTMNAAHDMEHYGNLVTYMRENGMVPPSSQGGGM
jgi:uncharacterized damage-inducible protein DinB